MKPRGIEIVKRREEIKRRLIQRRKESGQDGQKPSAAEAGEAHDPVSRERGLRLDEKLNNADGY
jgi:hypothetical protein